MSKPTLPEPEESLERELIEAMTEGLHVWRSDLSYPASYSDMQACARGIMKRFPGLLEREEDAAEISLPVKVVRILPGRARGRAVPGFYLYGADEDDGQQECQERERP